MSKPGPQRDSDPYAMPGAGIPGTGLPPEGGSVPDPPTAADRGQVDPNT